ncbi:Tannase and feruloyl esterase [Pannonibacter phragmitetus]|uniref:Tannase and feruloyl esterase n=1 Tax=Pannonibacter phragmitetus TaxID=121719 RepID=A0A379HJN2_9HYPH|nr:tannase/feruloyl esterase family alpha/beta hydrolase [Pannonibacter phragmitetus]SUC82758.1 Tannase and feruloyl esterase [Pannonibacter phragmitetus]
MPKAIATWGYSGSLTVLAALLLSTGISRAEDASPAFIEACRSVNQTGVPEGQVTQAQFNREEVVAGSTVPAHCLIRGVMRERKGTDGRSYALNFELRLPVNWNQRFFFNGGGGVDGRLPSATGTYSFGGHATTPLQDGYAVVTHDGGHVADYTNLQSNTTFLFGGEHQARLMYGHEHIPLVAAAARQLISAVYSEEPKFSYFVGCSNGGRQALMAAQRYPDLFDGIIANAPGFRLAQASIDGGIFRTQLAASVAPRLEDGSPDWKNTLTPEEEGIVKSRILAACDALDGAEDGMVSNWQQCTPDPMDWVCSGSSTDCLSPEKATYVKTFTEGAKTAGGKQVYSRWHYDPGMVGEMGSPSPFARWIFAGESSHVYTTPPTITSDIAGYALHASLDEEFAKLFATTADFPVSGAEFTNAESPDLDAFKAAGSKLFIMNGTADWAFSFHDVVAYREAVAERYGEAETDAFMKIFAVPGMGHCRGGAYGTDRMDFMTPLVEWVEKGRETTEVMSEARAEAKVSWPGRTRPICAYPRQAFYKGEGDIEDGANFVCR